MAIDIRIDLDTNDKVPLMSWVVFAKRTLAATLTVEGLAWHEISIGTNCEIWFKLNGINGTQYRLQESDRAALKQWIDDADGDLNPNPIRNRRVTFDEWDTSSLDPVFVG